MKKDLFKYLYPRIVISLLQTQNLKPIDVQTEQLYNVNICIYILHNLNCIKILINIVFVNPQQAR